MITFYHIFTRAREADGVAQPLYIGGEIFFRSVKAAMTSGDFSAGEGRPGCDQRSLVTLTPQLELADVRDAIAKTRPTSGSLVRPEGLTWG